MASVNFDIQLAIGQFQQSLDKANSSVKGFHEDFKKNTNNSTQAWNSFVGNLAAGAVGVAVKGITGLASSMGDLGVQAVKNAGELEMMSTELGVMLGSAAAGEAQLKKLQQFAATSPFQLPGIVEANKLLLAFGTTAAEVPDVLAVLGNIAAGSGKPIGDLARIFGQVQAETKLSLERMNQLNDAGVALGPTLANKLGIPLKDVRKAVTDGKVSFELFRQSLVEIQSEGGTYAGGMIKQSQTLQGVLSSLSDNFFNLSGEIGKSFLPIIKEVALGLIAFTDTLVQNMDNIKIAGQAFAVTTGLVAAYMVATNGAAIATWALNTALAVLTSPITLVVAAIIATGVAVYGLIKYWDDVKLAFLTGVQTILQALQPLEGIMSKYLGIDTDVITSSIDSIGLSIDKLKEKIAKKSEPIVDPKQLEAENKAAQEAAALKRAREQEELEALATKNALELEAKRLHQEQLLILEQEGLLAQRELKTANDTLTTEERTARESQDLARRQELEAQKLQLQIDSDMLKAKQETDAAAQKKAIQESAQKAEIARMTLHNKSKQDLDKQQAKNTKATNDQYLQDQATFLNTATGLANSSNKTAAAIGKAAALTQIAIQTPKAVASSFAYGSTLGGPPLGFVFGGIAAAAMALQASKVTGVGNFANGGFIPGSSFSGDKLQANVNSGEAVLNASQQKQFMKIANGEISGAGNSDSILSALNALGDRIASMEIVLVANDDELARSVSRGVQNGIEIGRSR